MQDYFLIADRRFYEPVDRRPIALTDFQDFLQGRIDETWRVARKGVWTHIQAGEHRVPRQGWKIHVSTLPLQARRLFETVAEYLVARRVSFKFLSDMTMVRLMNGKSGARGGSGKFFTIYPSDEAQFRALLADLEALTRGFLGPYILSDRRYKDSKVLHYRYGGIVPNDRLEPDGRKTAVLVSPDGKEIEDIRHPFYVLPDWVEEPFPSATSPAEEALNGRYTVERALHFSNTGGVYVAWDSIAGRRVVLKEARAHVHGYSDSDDAAAMLRREFEMLKAVEDAGVAPKPFELFQEWEHLFLAEEYLEGFLPLRQFSALGGVFLESYPTRERVIKHLRQDLSIMRRIAAIVDALHARGVVWGDISYNNVVIHPETLEVKILDLESAHVSGGPAPVRVATPGFADKRATATSAATKADDYYGVGSILLFLITHANGLLAAKPDVADEFLAEMSSDFGLPEGLVAAIGALRHEDPSRRPDPVKLFAGAECWLEEVGHPKLGSTEERRQEDDELARIVGQGCAFIEAQATFTRKDRLYPADPMVFMSNPMGLAHGAAGVGYALRRIRGGVDSRLVERLLAEPLAAESYPPGLHHGLGGIAWALAEMGEIEAARAALSAGARHAFSAVGSDYYSGLAGWGMAHLKVWLSSGDESALAAAREIGLEILRRAVERDGGLCWPGKDGLVSFGLGHGASGIALFLLYLDRALGGGFAEAARRAFEFELANAVELAEGGVSWKRDDGPQRIVSPYWRQGSAGVGIVALRFWRAFGDSRYREVVDRILRDCDRKYTVFPGRNDGLAGIGEFLLDAYQATGDRKFLAGARRAATGLKLFVVQQEEGVAFPGNGLSRLSCDLATGSAGILLFLDRLAHQKPSSFMLDELISGGSR